MLWGKWNLDSSRFAREQMQPGEYLTTSYYEHWLFGLEQLLHQSGLVSRDEMAARLADLDAPCAPRAQGLPDALTSAAIDAAMRRGGNARDSADVTAKFCPGDVVVVSNDHPLGHTRVPRYVRGKRGVVSIDHGVFVFPDSHAASGDRNPQHCYSVRFTASELWGSNAHHKDTLLIDLWDDYMEPA